MKNINSLFILQKLRATSNLLGGGWASASPPTVSSPPEQNLPVEEKESIDPELAKYILKFYCILTS